jgi:hypothetical protein
MVCPFTIGGVVRQVWPSKVAVPNENPGQPTWKGGNGWAQHAAPQQADGEKQKTVLFEFFGEDGELELGFGEGFDDGGLGGFGSGVAGGGHFADEQILGALEHFLFAEGEGLTGAEGNETLEDDSDFEEGSGAHALGVLFEAMFPVVVRVEFALFEKAENFGGLVGTDDGAKANSFSVGLRNHDAQAAGDNANHVIPFCSTVKDTVTDLLYNTHTVIRVHDLVGDLIVHGFAFPLGVTGYLRNI